MNNVNKTLYIPLYGKAFVSRKGIILDDKKAEQIWSAEQFPLSKKSKSKWLAYYMAMRAVVFDNWVKEQVLSMKDAIIIHLGCGMDSRVLRIDAQDHKWFDVDFAQVIDERKRYYKETCNYTMLAGDVRNSDWLENIPERKSAIIVMEGISMYLSPQELQNLIKNLCNHFVDVRLLMDCYTVFGAKMSKYKNPINDVGVKKVFGLDNPKTIENGEFSFVKELSMTPENCIDQLKGSEKFIFKSLFAGNFSKKLYKIYEYKKA